MKLREENVVKKRLVKLSDAEVIEILLAMRYFSDDVRNTNRLCKGAVQKICQDIADTVPNRYLESSFKDYVVKSTERRKQKERDSRADTKAAEVENSKSKGIPEEEDGD